MTDLWTLLQRRRRDDPGAPVVTFVAADGGRVELSAVSLENAAAKIGNTLVDEFGLDDGGRVGLFLPMHWQRATWLAGCWTAGCAVSLPDRPDATGVDVFVTTADATPATTGAAIVATVSLHPLGLPDARPLPAGVVDATLSVRMQPDAFLGPPPRPDDAALVWGTDTLTQEHVVDLARRRASTWGLDAGGRLLVTARADRLDSWLAALAVPLATSASVVLVDGDHDLDRLAAQEKVTAVVG